MSIKIDAVQVKRINVEAPDSIPEKQELDVKLDSEVGVSEDGRKCSLKLECTITGKSFDDDAPSIANTLIIGFFSSDESVSNDEKLQRKLIRELFPYVRSTIAMATSFVDVPTITLPSFDL